MEPLGLEWTHAERRGLKILGAYRHNGRWASRWKHVPATQAIVQRRLAEATRRSDVDVVVEIGDLAVVPAPYLIYQDLSFDLLIEQAGSNPRAPHFPGLGPKDLRRLADRQRRIYDGAAGVLTMSRWLADHLVGVTGLAPDRVHVVNPGINVAPAGVPDRPPARDRPRRLLFVGKDFSTKAGDQVVRAHALLRAGADPTLELTVAGPATWPMPGPVPDGVRFLGRVPLETVSRLYREHDLFVMPSWFEGFGIVFLEALAHGLPCVARRACAMPEIVQPGVNGDLVDSADPGRLADVILRVLDDDGLRDRTRVAADDVVRRYSWDRAAAQVLEVAASVR